MLDLNINVKSKSKKFAECKAKYLENMQIYHTP